MRRQPLVGNVLPADSASDRAFSTLICGILCICLVTVLVLSVLDLYQIPTVYKSVDGGGCVHVESEEGYLCGDVGVTLTRYHTVIVDPQKWSGHNAFTRR